MALTIKKLRSLQLPWFPNVKYTVPQNLSELEDAADTYILDSETGKRYKVTKAVTNGFLTETFTEVTT